MDDILPSLIILPRLVFGIHVSSGLLTDLLRGRERLRPRLMIFHFSLYFFVSLFSQEKSFSLPFLFVVAR